jgi:hypothetical protein
MAPLIGKQDAFSSVVVSKPDGLENAVKSVVAEKSAPVNLALPLPSWNAQNNRHW